MEIKTIPGYKTVVYDLEVYPNYFLALFWDPDVKSSDDLESGGGWVSFTDFHLDGLKKYLTNSHLILVGYNSLSYDDVILKAIYHNKVQTALDIYNLSSLIINRDKDEADQDYIKTLQYGIKKPWADSVDLMALAFKDDDPGAGGKASLKELAVRMNWEKIQDLPIDPNQTLSEMQMEIVGEYCENDVKVTADLWNRLHNQVLLRLELQDQFEVKGLISQSDAGVCEHIFRTVYQRKTDLTPKDISNLKNAPEPFSVGELIPDWIKFSDPQLRELLAYYKSLTLQLEKPDKYDTKPLTKEIIFGGLTYSLGAGGLHSKDQPAHFTSKNKQSKIYEVDVSSYYPSLILLANRSPIHLTDVWLEILRELTEKRLNAKKLSQTTKDPEEQKKQKTISDSLKIVINSAFGKCGNKYSFMYDYRVLLSATLLGQLAILMLIEKLGKHEEFKILSSNTDGATVEVPDKKDDIFRIVCKNWEEDTKLNLEFTEYFTYTRLSISDYFCTTPGPQKRKGFFKNPTLFSKNDAVIIRDSVISYFVTGCPVEAFIKENENIYNFLYSYKTTRTFKTSIKRKVINIGLKEEIEKKISMEPEDEFLDLQRTNRWYVSTSKSDELVKIRIEAKEGSNLKVGAINSLPNGSGAVVKNDIDSFLPSNLEIPIDYDHYIAAANEVINQIEIMARVEDVKAMGFYPIPKKTGKGNPAGARLDEIKEDWDFSGFGGVGIYTGPLVKVLAIDIDDLKGAVEKCPEIYNLLIDSFTIYHGEGSRDDVRHGRKKGTILYKCDNAYLRTSTPSFFKKYGFEVIYGKKPVQLYGLHPSNEPYHYEGKLKEIPEPLLLWLLEYAPKISNKKPKVVTVEGQKQLFIEEKEPTKAEEVASGDKDSGIEIVQSVLPYWHFSITENKFGFQLVGYCPYKDEHTQNSHDKEFYVKITPSSIYCHCFHMSCGSSRNELNRKLYDEYNSQLKRIEDREKDLAKVKIVKDFGECKTIRDCLTNEIDHLITIAPTGSGKTTESARYFIECLQTGIPVAYAANNRTDQEQFCDMLQTMTKKTLKDLYTYVLRGGQHLDHELDIEGNVKIPKSTLGIVTHHTYLKRKGISVFFYSFLKWIMDKQPVLLIDEGDRLCESLTTILNDGARYRRRQQRGAKEGQYLKLNVCPAFAKNGNCGNCEFKTHQTFEVNQFAIPEIKDASKILEGDWETDRFVDYPNMRGKDKIMLGNMTIFQLEQHPDLLAKKEFRFNLRHDEHFDSKTALREMIENAFMPVTYQYNPLLNGKIVSQEDILANEDAKKEVEFPYHPCNVRYISLKDRSILQIIKKHCRKSRWLSARFSPSNIDFIKSVFTDIEEKEIDISGQQIDELLIVGIRGSVNYVSHKRTGVEMFFQGLEKFGKVLTFEPKKAQAQYLHDRLPPTYPAGCYAEDAIFVRESFAEGKWKMLITHSRGALGRSINLPQFYTVFIKGLIFKPTMAFDLTKFTEEELIKRRQEDRISMIMQNAGRILRGGKGRKVIVLQNSEDYDVDDLAIEFKSMVKGEIKTTFYKLDSPDLLKETINHFHRKGEVLNDEPTPEEMAKVTSEKTIDVKTKKRIEKLKTDAHEFEGTWREFAKNKHPDRLKKQGKIDDVILNELKAIFETKNEVQK